MCCRTWDTPFHYRTITTFSLPIWGSWDFPPFSCSGCAGSCFYMWGRNGSAQVSSPTPPWINSETYNPPFAAAVFLSDIDLLKLHLHEYCMSRNQWWSNARHAAGTQFIVVVLLRSVINEVDIYLPHMHWRVHAQAGRTLSFLHIPSRAGCLWWNMTVFSEVFVHIMTSNDFLDGIGPSGYRARHDSWCSHQGPVTPLRQQTRSIIKWVLVM